MNDKKHGLRKIGYTCSPMLVCTTAESLSAFLSAGRAKKLTIGFVPTMGALHAGHISLIDAAVKENDLVVSSIFVNRAQFNDSSDYDKYPRMPEQDLPMLEAAGCHAVFMPDEKEMFPAGWIAPELDFGMMETVMEGTYRPGHFQGMIRVVHRLFELVAPDRAYFGEKDFQQLALIRALAARKHPSIRIIGCATMREADGLAMSSRNQLLTPEQRKQAPLIFNTLKSAADRLKKGEPVTEIKKRVEKEINQSQHFRLQYFAIVDPETLQLKDTFDGGQARLCIAVLTDGPRLIDNILVT